MMGPEISLQRGIGSDEAHHPGDVFHISDCTVTLFKEQRGGDTNTDITDGFITTCAIYSYSFLTLI